MTIKMLRRYAIKSNQHKQGFEEKEEEEEEEEEEENSRKHLLHGQHATTNGCPHPQLKT